MLIDEIISEYNKRYTFKIIAFLILSLPSFQNSSQLQNIIFSLVTPNFTCLYQSTGNNHSISQDQCSVKVNGSTIKCTHWNFATLPIGKTMVSDYKLVCENKFYGDLVHICWYTTFLISPLFGILSDKFGRKKIVLFCLFLETISSIALALAPNIVIHILFRMLQGISGSGLSISQVWLLEMVNIEFRPFVGSFYWIYFAISYMVFPLIVYSTFNWRLTQLLSLVPSSLYLAILLIPESPRWSYVQNRKRELMTTLGQIAQMNQLKYNLTDEDIYIEKSNVKGSFYDAFRHREFLFCLFFSFLLIFSTNIIYLATIFDIKFLSNNIFLSVFLLGVMELPGLVLSYLSLKYLRRKTQTFIFGGIGSTLLLLSVFLNSVSHWQAILKIILGCIAKVIVSSTNQSTMVYIIELLPTTHRSFGYNFMSVEIAAAYLSLIYINKLSVVYNFLPMLIYAIVGWISLIIMFFYLAETKDLPIPETLEDLKRLNTETEENYLYYMNNKSEFVNETSSESAEPKSKETNENTQLINRKK